MAYNPAKHHRRSIRLKGYDYSSPGAYFITICTHQRDCLFGEIADGTMQLNQLGQIVSASWQRLPDHFSTVELDAFVVMPNHIHGILVLTDRRGAALGQHISLTTEDTLPNATPNPTKSNPHGQRICPTTGDAIPNATESNAGVAFGQEIVMNGVEGMPNAAPLRLSQSPAIADVISDSLQSDPGVAFGQGIVMNGVEGMPNAVPLQSGSLGAILLNFKSVTTRRINQIRGLSGVPVWQRNYYEHIIRDDKALQRIQEYIQQNPLSWQVDRLHPNHSLKL